MSVLIVTKIQGDTAKFSQALKDRASEFTQIADRARSVGAIHHQFGGERIDRHGAPAGQPCENGILGGAQPERADELVVELRDMARCLA